MFLETNVGLMMMMMMMTMMMMMMTTKLFCSSSVRVSRLGCVGSIGVPIHCKIAAAIKPELPARLIQSSIGAGESIGTSRRSTCATVGTCVYY